MKRCSSCKEEKPLDDFHKKSPTTYQSSCKACRKVYVKQHYEANKSAYIERNARQRQRKRDEVTSEWRVVPCIDCGGIFPPYVMQFDHVQGEKKGNVMTMVGRASDEAVRAEIAKCEVVCANCHAVRTYTRLHSSDR